FVTGSNTDDGTSAIALPFPFYLYGVPYTSLNASTNGNAQFGASNTTAYNNTCPIPSNTFTDSTIMPYWDDLNLGTVVGDGIYTQTIGVVGNRVFIIEWRGVTYT